MSYSEHRDSQGSRRTCLNIGNLAGVFAAVILALVSIAGVDSVASAADPAGSISGTVFQADGTTPAGLALR
jgi:hypothetical protein